MPLFSALDLLRMFYLLFLGKAYPFTLGVTTNEDEVCSDAEENMAILCEASVTPGGIIGFALGFSQMSC